MKIYFKCGCGNYNYNLSDWLCHFKYKGLKSGLRNLFLTKIQFKKDF